MELLQPGMMRTVYSVFHQQGVQLLFYAWKIVISREMISHERKNIRQESHPPGK